MGSGPRTPSRPGSGPGRGRSGSRASTRRTATATPSARSGQGSTAVAPAGPLLVRRPRNLTARAIALTVVLLILTISYASSLRIYFAQASDLAATRAEIAEREARIVELQGELARWEDPAYVRTQARQRLGWVVPGETGFKVVDAEGRPLGGGAEIAPGSETVPEPRDAWWAKLWGSVAAADQPAPAPAPGEAAADKPITEDTTPR